MQDRKYRNLDPVASHIVLLTRVFDKSEGDVLEVGTGYFSTLLLHWLSSVYKRHVYSYESSNYWYKRAKKYESEYHHIIYCPDWEEADFVNKHWGMAFIDQSPESVRNKTVTALKNNADYIVMHDTSPEYDKKYQFSKIWDQFQHIFHYKKAEPNSSVVSNYFSLEDLA